MSKSLLRAVLNRFGIDVVRYNNKQLVYKSLLTKYRDFTMIPETLFIANLELGEQVKIEGDFVECGVWRGGMSAAFAETNPHRMIHLFDSFEGLPLAKEIDGEAALEWQSNKSSENYYDNCTATEDFAHQAMKLAQLTNYKVYKGWFEETLRHYNGNPIAILRLDGDWYESISTCLRELYPVVSKGGLVLLDDYYTWDGCARATHDYLSKTKSSSRIHSWKGVAYIMKND